MGEFVQQALKEAERAAKKQKLCVDVSASSIAMTLRNLMAARAQVRHSSIPCTQRVGWPACRLCSQSPCQLQSSPDWGTADCWAPAMYELSGGMIDEPPDATVHQVQETKTAEAVAREVSSLVERLHAADKISAVSDATKDLHTAISKLEKARSRQLTLKLYA